MGSVAARHLEDVCVDFDGTIADSDYPDTGVPIEGVREALFALRGMGYRIRIYSCRLCAVEPDGRPRSVEELGVELAAIQEFMERNDLPYDDVVLSGEGKPHAAFYIDDKAVCFRGSWTDTIDRIRRERK
jgi:hypothetical protein